MAEAAADEAAEEEAAEDEAMEEAEAEERDDPRQIRRREPHGVSELGNAR